MLIELNINKTTPTTLPYQHSNSKGFIKPNLQKV